jgi:hypothetical protein
MNSRPSEKLPRGIWYEAEKNRYRVRKYRNSKSYLVYCGTEEEAREVLIRIKAVIARIPRRSRKERETRAISAPKFGSLAKAIRES